MKRTICILAVGALLGAATFGTRTAAADDRVTMGRDIHVGADERAGDVFSMGGDIRIDGVAEGDVVTAGGNVLVAGRVEGDVASAGGDIRIEGVVEGEVATAGGRVLFGPEGRVEGTVRGAAPSAASRAEESSSASFFRSLGGFTLLFLLAFGFSRVAGDRFHTLRAAMVRAPVKAPLVGLAFFCAAIVAILGSAVTVVGIPVALVLAVALALAVYLGLGMSAAVLGAVLPVPRLRDNETAQLAAGVGLLFLVSLVPFFGGAALALATLFGLGAVAMTRLGRRPVMPAPEGPYR